MKKKYNSWLLLAAIATALVLPSQAIAAKSTKDTLRKNRAAADELFNRGTPLILRIEIPDSGMKSLRQDARKYVPATIHEGLDTYTNVQLHLKGSAGSYRGVDDKPGLTLKLDSGEGENAFHGLGRFHLNNSVQDPTYLSEAICGEIFRKAGVPAPRAAHALVELNGRRLGLYVLLETIDRDFLSSYFKKTRGNVYGQPGGADITEPLQRMAGDGEITREDLKALAAAVQENNPDQLAAKLDAVLDVDRYLSFMALEVMLCHWDGYTFAAHNYRVFHDEASRKMVFIPHDLDQLLGDASVPMIPGANGSVSQAILRTPKLRARYVERFGQIFTNQFVVSELTNRIHKMVAKLAPALKAYDREIGNEFPDRSESLKERIVSRAQQLTQQLGAPTLAPLRFEDGVARLVRWRRNNDGGGAELEKLDEPPGKPSLWIKATGPTASSWRSKVLLENGKYSFEGSARCKGVVPQHDELRGDGAGLRISGNQQPRRHKLAGDSPWEKLAFEFEVDALSAEVELVCELRASQGEVWFDEDSLRLVRKK